MERDIQIHTEDVDRLRAELEYVCGYFREIGHKECDLLFGFAWRSEADESISWKNVRIPVVEVNAEIRNAENAGLGNFARDDLWVAIDDRALKVQFCHHSGIHLSFSQPDEITEHFFARWEAEGLNPIEWEKTEDPQNWHRIRGNEA
jgi:hypothetical protein